MRAVLLAAGRGTRLRPLTLTVPKCLVEIRRKPLLDYWLEHLLAAEVDEVMINTHWLADIVREHVAASPWRDRITLVHEDELLGTGGTVIANREWIGQAPFLLAHADNLTDFDVADLVVRHRSRPGICAITMLAFRADDPRSCGILECDPSGIVTAFHEKVESPPGNLANAAVYVCEPEVIEFIATLEKLPVDFSTEVIPAFMGRILAVETEGYHRDIGSVESLGAAEREFGAQASRGARSMHGVVP